ncbi:MAG: hypothetical protein Q4F10_13460 [Corynebacterium glutamicum]|uniref:hypothetical protein n=1 Tax=Corynebacterium glutamicum TaxID=1718 RepID=UPI00097B3F3C|nr:hypothetical protein [Corynebacterium glutamicum]MDO5374453.1 hypothetical protein [Corynebacterium glutamicum]GAV96802.1 hypothetical protein CS176_1032 [Corynebacterium glutamicum]
MNAPESTYRLISGFLLLLIAIISPIGFLFALPEGYIQITATIAFAVVALDIIVAVSLYPVIRSGGCILGIVSTVLRCAYALGLLIAAVALVKFLRQLD